MKHLFEALRLVENLERTNQSAPEGLGLIIQRSYVV